MTDHRALERAIRRRMQECDEKYSEARGALMAASGRTRGGEPVVLAEGGGEDWPWVFEASRSIGPEVPSVFYTVRRRPGKGVAWSRVSLAENDVPVTPRFFQDPESDASVLCGPIAEGVEKVVVEPVVPISGPERHSAIVSEEGLGRFFVIAFDEPVEEVRVRVEPRERFDNHTASGFNVWLADRRRSVEGVELGRGDTPGGKRWRLRFWRALPEDVRVDLRVIDGAGIDHREREISGAGYGGPEMSVVDVITARMIGGGVGDERHIVGEIAPHVAKVAVRLDDGSELDAQLVRTDLARSDYFLAFFPSGQEVVAVDAMDHHNRPIGRQDIKLPHHRDEPCAPPDM